MDNIFRSGLPDDLKWLKREPKREETTLFLSEEAINEALDLKCQNIYLSQVCSLRAGEKRACLPFVGGGILSEAEESRALQRLFLLHCNHSLKLSDFEKGINPCEAAHWVYNYLEEFQKRLEGEDEQKIDQVKAIFSGCLDRELEEITSDRQCLLLADKYAEKVKALLVGEKMSLAGGWGNSSGGHAVTYLIEKVGRNQCHFIVINSGQGGSYHVSEISGIKTKYFPLVLEGLSEEDLDQHFFSMLFFFRSYGLGKEWDCDKFYSWLLSHKKKESSLETEFTPLSSQKGPSCSLKSNLALLHHVMGRELYKEFLLFMKYETALAFYQKFPNFWEVEEHRHLTSGNSDVIEKLFSAGVSSAYNRELLQQMAYGLARLCFKRQEKECHYLPSLEDVLTLAKGLLIEKEKAENVIGQKYRGTYEYADPLSPSVIRPIPSGWSWDDHFVDTARNVYETPEITPIPVLNYDGELNIVELNRRISHSKCESMFKLVMIEQFVKQLPIPTGEGIEFWETMTNEREKCELLISDLALLLSTYREEGEFGILEGYCLGERQWNVMHTLFCAIHYAFAAIFPEIRLSLSLDDWLDKDGGGKFHLLLEDIERFRQIHTYYATTEGTRLSEGISYPKQDIRPDQLTPFLKFFYDHIYLQQVQTNPEVLNRYPRTSDVFNYIFVHSPHLDTWITKNLELFSHFRSAIELILSDEFIGGFLFGTQQVPQDLKEKTHKRHFHTTLNKESFQVSLETRVDPVSPTDPSPEFEIPKKYRSLERFDKAKAHDLLLRQCLTAGSLRPVDLLGYIKRFFHDLDKTQRNLIEVQLFKSPHVEVSLEEWDHTFYDHYFQKEFLSLLEKKLKLINDHRLGEGQFDLVQFFLLRLALHLLARCKSEQFSSQLHDVIATVMENLDQADLSLEGRKQFLLHRLYWHIVLFERGQNNCVDVLSSWCALKLNPQSLEDDVYILYHILESRVLPQLSKIAESLVKNPEEASRLCEKIFGRQCTRVMLDRSELSFYDQIGKRAKYALVSGKIQDFDGRIKNIPSEGELLRSCAFTCIFCNGHSHLTFTRNDGYLSFKEGEIDYRAFFDRSEMIIERKFEDQWGSYNEAVLSNCFPVWIYHYFTRWQVSEREWRLTNRATREWEFTYHFQEGLLDREGHKIVRVDDSSILSRFEDPKRTAIIEREEGESEIIFFRFPGSNLILKDQTWCLKSDPSLRLVMSFDDTLLGHFHYFLLFEDPKGHQIALIGDDRYILDSGTICFREKAKPHAARSYLIPIEKGHLAPQTAEERAFAAYIYLGMRDFTRSHAFLQKISSNDLIDSEQVLNICKEIYEFSENFTEQPSATAVRMYAGYLLSKATYWHPELLDRLNDGKIEDGEKQALLESFLPCYKKYLELLTNIPFPLRLSQLNP